MFVSNGTVHYYLFVMKFVLHFYILEINFLISVNVIHLHPKRIISYIFWCTYRFINIQSEGIKGIHVLVKRSTCLLPLLFLDSVY